MQLSLIKKIAFISGIILSILGGGSPLAHAAGGLYLKTPAAPAAFLLKFSGDTTDSRATSYALQGLVNQTSAEVFIDQRTNDRAQIDYSGKPYTVLNTALVGGSTSLRGVRTLFNKYHPSVQKMFLYDPAKDWTFYLAFMAGAQQNGIPVTDTVRAALQAQVPGWAGTVVDYRNIGTTRVEGYTWALANLMPNCTKKSVYFAKDIDLVCMDYVAATKSFVFNLLTSDTAEAAKINEIFATPGYGVGTAMGGYAGDSVNRLANPYGIGYNVSNFYSNGSFWSSFPNKTYTQAAGEAITAQKGKVYVSIILSDGDNLQFAQGALYTNWRSDPNRGTVPVGTSMPPALQELDTPLMDWYYANRTANDELIAGPCGFQFIYLDDYNSALLPRWSEINAKWCADGGFSASSMWAGTFPSANYDTFTAMSGLSNVRHNSNLFPISANPKFSNGIPIFNERIRDTQSEQELYEDLAGVATSSTAPIFATSKLITARFGSTIFTSIKTVVDRLNTDFPGKYVFQLPRDQAATATEYFQPKRLWNTSNGTWDTTTSNWLRRVNGAATATTFTNNASQVVFGDVAGVTADSTITLSSTVTPKHVTIKSTTRNYTLSGTGKIGGSTALILDPTNTKTLTLLNANTYTGSTTINGGNLTLGTGGKLGNGTYGGLIRIATGTFLNIATSTSQTLSGTISGCGTLSRTSGADLTLTGSAGNTINNLIVANGRVLIGNALAITSQTATVIGANGILNLNVAPTTCGPITIQNTGGISVRANATLNNVILPGSGTVDFNNDEATTGALVITNNQTLSGTVTLQIGGSRMTSTTPALGSVTFAGAITGSGGLTMTSSGNASNTALFRTGRLILSGANTYSGTTTVSGGTLRLAHNAALGSSPLVAIGDSRLEIATDTALASSPALSSQGGTFVSDRASPGAGLTRAFGNTSIGNGLTTFAAGSNVTSGTTTFQLASVSNNNGATATPGLNPTTANVIITGGVTLGTSNAGIANLTLGGTGSVNSIGGAIVNGTRATGNVIKSGTSTWTLSGANTYTGTTTITGGTLALGASNTLPSTAVSIGNATLNAATFTDTLGTLDATGSAVINLGAGARLAFADSSAIDWSGGTLTLTGTFVSGSSLRFGTTSGGLTPAQLSQISAPGISRFVLNASGFLTEVTYTITNTTSDANGTCTPTGVVSVVGGGSQTYTLTPNTDCAVATLTVNGVPVTPALSYTFNNVSANQTIRATFASTTTLYWDSDGNTPGFGSSAGTWGTDQFWSFDPSGSSAPIPITTATKTSVYFGSATLNYNNPSVTVAPGGVNAGNITFSAGQSTALTLSGGPITLGSTALITVNNAANTIASVLAGAGTSLTKAGTGTLTLSAANTYSGTTAIATGTLKLGASNVLPDGPGKGNVAVAGTLDLNTFSETLNGLSGAGTVNTVAGGTPTLTLGGADATSTFNGTLTNTTGTLALAKTGSGTVTLAGANSYSGPTSISAGTLALSGAGTLGGTSSALTLSGGQLDLGGLSRTQGAVLITAPAASGDTIRNGTLTGTSFAASNPGGNAIISATLAGPSGFTKSGNGTVTLAGANTFSGNTTVSGGTLRLTSNAALGSSPLVTIAANRLEIATDTALSSSPALSSQGGTFVSDRATPGAGLTRALGNTSIGNGLTTFAAGANVTSGTTTIQLASVSNNNGSTATPGLNPTTANVIITGGVTLGTSNAGIANLTLGGTGSANSIGGAIVNGTRATGNVIKSGTSTWTLSGTNTYTGNTTVTGGLLVTTKAAALPGFNTAARVVFNGGTLGARVGGSGWTTAEVNTLLTSATKTSGALGIDTTNGNLTQWTAFTSTNLGATLGLTKLGANTLTLNLANTYAGATVISGGTLALGASNVLPSTAVSLGNATLNAATFSDTVGTLAVTGSATINLGTGATLAFATGSPAWTGTLTLTGTFVSGSSLRFGTTSSGLTPAQLSQISAPGFTGFGLNASGFLTATPLAMRTRSTDTPGMDRVPAPLDFTSWITGTFANGQVPAGQQGPDNDPDNDGIPNLLEYALADLDPTVANATVGTFTGDALNYTLSYSKRAGTSGLTYIIQQSTDLSLPAGWTTVTGLGYVDNATTISYTFIPGSLPRLFLRLIVIQAP